MARDIDDALAILLLAASPGEARLEGISVNFGNVPLARGVDVARPGQGCFNRFTVVISHQ